MAEDDGSVHGLLTACGTQELYGLLFPINRCCCRYRFVDLRVAVEVLRGGGPVMDSPAVAIVDNVGIAPIQTGNR